MDSIVTTRNRQRQRRMFVRLWRWETEISGLTTPPVRGHKNQKEAPPGLGSPVASHDACPARPRRHDPPTCTCTNNAGVERTTCALPRLYPSAPVFQWLGEEPYDSIKRHFHGKLQAAIVAYLDGPGRELFSSGSPCIAYASVRFLYSYGFFFERNKAQGLHVLY